MRSGYSGQVQPGAAAAPVRETCHVIDLTRRTALGAGAGVAAAVAAAPYAGALGRLAAAGIREPDSLPDPSRPAGTVDPAMPFDHVVVVMQENHSFDNYLGMLPLRGQPRADGFAFDATGRPRNANPYRGGHLTVQRAPSLCQASGPGQSWRSTHLQVDGGRMDGFADRTSPVCMLYYDEQDLPFYYWLAKTFCLGDRWFCSAPCQTYPNRRFLLAATAFGLISTDTSSITQDPPNGTIVDRLDAHGVTWRDYFSDVPATGVIASIPEKHPQNLAGIDQFYADCAAGTLPSVSFVDSDIGIAGVVADGTFGQVPAPFAAEAHDKTAAQSQSEEGPADISLGENFVSQVTNAVLGSPLWPRILLVWNYDEHGGYYDHVPPPAAIAPDDIKPRLGPNDPPGGYDVYGPRVPAVAISGHARPNTVTSVVHDHTSILATIQAKWNLPFMTRRDANAATMMDFLDATRVTFPEPPVATAPSDLAASEQRCSTAPPAFTVQPGPPPALTNGRAAAAHLVLRFYGRRHVAGGGVLVVLQMRHGTIGGLRLELLRAGAVVARAAVGHVGGARHRVALRPLHGHHLAGGRYTLVVRQGHRTLVRRRVRLGRLHQ
jgi:phospholipase C